MSERTKIHPLTSTRFVAAFLILLAHSAGPAPFGFSFSTMTSFILGSAGVAFFFVLSGFILTYTYGTLATGTDVRNFWAARFSRIWPTHALTFLMCIALLPSEQWALGANAAAPGLANITLTHAFIPVPQSYFSFNAPSWTISTEAGFYLLYPLAALAMARRAWLPAAAGSVLVVLMIAATVALGLPAYGAETTGQATSHGMISVHPLARFFEFACGMVAARLWMSRSRSSLSPTAFTLLEVGALALAVASVIGFQYLAAALEARGLPNAVTLWVHFGSSSIPFALLIVVLACGRGAVARILSAPFLVILGEISFAMYMLHQIVLRVMVHNGIQAPATLVWPAFALFVVFVAGLSYAVWIGLERPARRALNRLLRREAPRAAPRDASGDSDQPALLR